MNSLIGVFTKLRVLFSGNKRILIPLVPLVLFIVAFIVFVFFSAFSPSAPLPPQEDPLTPTPSIAIDIVSPTEQPGEDHSDGDGDMIVSYEDISTFQKKEPLPEGLFKYAFFSGRPGRPNIIVASPDGQGALFESSVSSPTALPSLSEYLSLFGQPERTFVGSKFYGPSAHIYIYAQTKGFAFIADPKTNTVLETHHFPPMSVEDYIRRFGEDIQQ